MLTIHLESEEDRQMHSTQLERQLEKNWSIPWDNLVDLELWSSIEDRHSTENKLQNPTSKKNQSSIVEVNQWRENNLWFHLHRTNRDTKQRSVLMLFHSWGRSNKNHSTEDDSRRNSTHLNFSPMKTNKQLQISTIQPKDSTRTIVDQRWNDSNWFLNERTNEENLNTQRGMKTNRRSWEDLFDWRESIEWDSSCLDKCSNWCSVSALKNNFPHSEQRETIGSLDWSIGTQN